jgi:hypothetical protein
MRPTSLVRGATLITPPFAIAVGVLLVAAVLGGPVSDWLDIKLTKKALPLKAPLASLDIAGLAPYSVLQRSRLEPAMVEALDTEEYLHWIIEDTSVPPKDPTRHATLFITYYSGGRDLVPHTPDVCHLAAGYQPAQMHENLEVEIRTLGTEPVKVPVRVGTFMQTAVHSHKKHTVVYTFSCNGEFVCTRTGVRLLINELGNVYAYYGKVEISFPEATRAESVAAAEKLLNRVLPVLERDHWPDFEEAEARARK